MWNIVYSILLCLFVAVMLFISSKQYFNASSHYEDYYIVVALVCTLSKYILLLVLIILNIYDFKYASVVHFLETFSYWFVLIFLLKQINFKKRNTSRALNLVLTTFQLTVFSVWPVFLGSMTATNFPDNMNIIMKFGSMSIYSVDVFIEKAQIIMILVSLILCHKLRNLIMTLTISFMLIAKMFHYINVVLYYNFDEFYFYLEQLFKIIYMASLSATLILYYKNRTVFFKKKVGKK